MGMDAKQTGRCRRMILAGVAMAMLVSPMCVGMSKADVDDGFGALAVLMGVGLEQVEAKVRIQDKAFIDQCTDAAIERWRARDIRVSSLWDAKKLEDECVAEAVAREVGAMKADADAKEAKDKAQMKEEEAISDRLAASHRTTESVVVAPHDPLYAEQVRISDRLRHAREQDAAVRKAAGY
jgi:hypothetical protein